MTHRPPSLFFRRRDDGMRPGRGSLVATPTAELSNQEEMLLGDILDWSLESSCSGYEGDQEEESETEKDSDSKYEDVRKVTLCEFKKRVFK